ncbi:MAG: hypothetical protein LBV09_07525 [Deferribacteraceae bacterium]|jgi:NAD-dependent dihydropyrimidine dehydrogenase PreA subunit|nr:hypothetical protein [Deferribacteraceae bacterium]
MVINNSTELLVEYINGLLFSLVYVEENFPFPIESNVTLRKQEALDYLINASVVGNKSIGFFHKLPQIPLDKPLRGGCLLVSASLPDGISVPTFFCRKPDNVFDIFAKALKTSLDTNMPVQIIISPNALNSYIMQSMPIPNQDRVSPYISPATFDIKWDFKLMQQKLTAAYENLTQSTPFVLSSGRVVFEQAQEEFPQYIIPVVEQAKSFSNLKEIHTTHTDLRFLQEVMHRLRLDIAVTADIEAEEPQTKTVLCPGCPFVTIFSNLDLSGHMVLTTITCPAVEKVYPVHAVTSVGYMGAMHRKLNKPTVFITNLSEIKPFNIKPHGNDYYIVLADIDEKGQFPLVNAPYKLKTLKSCTLPYSCNNIKRYSKIKVNTKSLTDESILKCIEKTRCPAIYSSKTALDAHRVLKINTALCTGCKSCVVNCETKALS